MPTIVSGARGTANVNTRILKIDMSEVISLLEPDRAPLTTFLNKLDTKMSAKNYKFEWLEDVHNPRWDYINLTAGYAAGDTDIIVDNSTYFRAYDLVRVPRTGEVMLVTSISAPTLTVTRSWGSTAAAALVDNEPLQIIANAIEQGSAKGTGRTTQKSEKYNYTQIIRSHPFGFTGTMEAMETYGGNQKAYERNKKLVEQFTQIERAFIFGEKAKITTGTHPQTSTGGLMEWITSNVYDVSGVGGTLTEANFEKSFCEDLFRYGSNKRLLLAGSRLVSVINLWAKGKMETITGQDSFGLSLKRYISAHGELIIMKHHLFEVSSYLTGMGIALDMTKLKQRFLPGRELLLKTNVQTNGTDAEEDEYLSEVGLELRQELCHGIIKAVTN